MIDIRAEILNKLKASVTGSNPPVLPEKIRSSVPPTEHFKTMLTSIGGSVVELQNTEELALFIKDNYDSKSRILSCIGDLNEFETRSPGEGLPHQFDNVNLVILEAEFAVAENGAVWVTDQSMTHRVLPFITQHLLVVVPKTAIVATMHEAYDRIGDAAYEFGIFIAGPSKTADIEQSLVLGAHGPKTMTVILM